MFSMRNMLLYRNNGMTFLELVVTIAIAAILSAIAAPSFVTTTQRFRVMGETTALVSTMSFARSEAIRRGEPVSVCASADGASCLSSSLWHQGWIVFSDRNANRTVGTILKKQPALVGSDTVNSDNSASFVTFSADGFTMALPASFVTFAVRTAPANTYATQCLVINKTGRLQTQSTGTGSCT